MPPVAPLPIPSLVPPHASAAVAPAAAAQPGPEPGPISTPAFVDRPQLAARLDALPLAGTTLGRLREQQLKFGVGRTSDQHGSPVTEAFPENAATEQALRGADPERLDRSVTGLLGQLDARGGGSLDRVVLSTSKPGLAANMTETVLHSNPGFVAGASDDEVVATARKGSELYGAQAAGTAAAHKGSSLILGPELSQILVHSWQKNATVAPAAAAALGYYVGHELEHAVTPARTDAARERLGWLEEGTAETLALWPGAVTRTATGLGIGADPRQMAAEEQRLRHEARTTAYGPATDTVRGLLGIAGVSPHVESDAARARELLQRHPLEQVPDDLAAGIVGARRLAPERAGWIADQIRALDGNPERLAAFATALDAG